tara:strand:+ start:2344 stop:2559 length:216 start_codon:yes stop_codon:yes gene_type:complete
MSQDKYYKPDKEEMDMAIEFVKSCTNQDLCQAWVKSSKEWEKDSLVELHRAIVSSGRIQELVDNIQSMREE